MTIRDRLRQAKARPSFVQDAVRTALRDAIAWRIGGGAAPGTEALIAGAVAAARTGLDATDCDSGERSCTLAAVQEAARRFARSALCGRLMRVPAAQFLHLPAVGYGPDAIVRDRRGRLHAIVVMARGDALDAGEIANAVARTTRLPIGYRLRPLTVHVFSLATAQRHTFERSFDPSARRTGATRVA